MDAVALHNQEQSHTDCMRVLSDLRNGKQANGWMNDDPEEEVQLFCTEGEGRVILKQFTEDDKLSPSVIRETVRIRNAAE